MSERIQRQRGGQVRPQDEVEAAEARQVDTSGLDALLDEIDAVLESDAEDYVRGFVQKGGQ